MIADEALICVLQNLPPTPKEAARVFVGLLGIDTVFWLDRHIRAIAKRYRGVDPEAEMRDELQLIADGRFAKKKRYFDGDETVLFFKRGGQICPLDIWLAHGGPDPDIISKRGGVYIRVWPRHPDVHWHIKHEINKLASLEKVDENGVRYITTEDVVSHYGIADSVGVNARAKAGQKIKYDPNYVSVGDHKYANIASMPPAQRSNQAEHACYRAINQVRVEFKRAFLAAQTELLAQTFADMMDDDLPIDVISRMADAAKNKYIKRLAAEKTGQSQRSAK